MVVSREKRNPSVLKKINLALNRRSGIGFSRLYIQLIVFIILLNNSITNRCKYVLKSKSAMRRNGC